MRTPKGILILALLAGCVHDASTAVTWPAPLGSLTNSHCAPMFASEVIGCTYTDADARVSHELCFESAQGSWWCSGRARPAMLPLWSGVLVSRAFQEAAATLYLDNREAETVKRFALGPSGTLGRWMSGAAVPSREIQREVIAFASNDQLT